MTSNDNKYKPAQYRLRASDTGYYIPEVLINGQWSVININRYEFKFDAIEACNAHAESRKKSHLLKSRAGTIIELGEL